MAFVGLVSIGSAALELMLSRLPHPRSVLLCDVQGSSGRLAELGARVRRSTGYRGGVAIVEATPTLPSAVYDSGLLVGATSSPGIVEVGRLRPGTVVVDDSFPHCFDVATAVTRMRGAADVLLVGGGLLDCGPVGRTVHLPPVAASLEGRITGRLPEDGIASCRLESLLLAADPSLPRTLGLVQPSTAASYWEAVEAAGVRAGALHLGDYHPDDQLLERLRSL